MKQYNRKNRRKNRSGSLGETEDSAAEINSSQAYIDTAKEGGLVLISAIAACGVGAAIGKHSLIVGIPITLVGVYKKNPYIVAAGLGLALSNGFQRSSSTVQGVNGVDFKQVAQDAKDRVSTFFENFKDKLYLSHAPTAPQTTGATNGLGEASQEQVTYFVNPYAGDTSNIAALPEIDMSAIDRIQEQIAEMSKTPPPIPTAGLNEVEREF